MKMPPPKIGIYAGSGTSHSWLWFVDLFEKASLYDLVFLDEFSVQNNDIKDLDILIISGGDTFAVARSLGAEGGRNIKLFVEQGGVYIGSCAGAYLPMKSSKAPLDLFNFVDIKITNLSKILPTAEIKTCKFCTSYGCDFVFHPAREAVALKTTAIFDREKTMRFEAPLYGGPGMKAKDESWVLATYEGFTSKTSFLTSRQIAEKTLVKTAAVVRVPFGRGYFYLLGPHLEHPGFKTANQFIIDGMIQTKNKGLTPYESKRNTGLPPNDILTGKTLKTLLLSIRRELSNSRIVASSLEFLPIQWLIGQKVYEPQKIRVYLESMWKRLGPLEKKKIVIVETGLAERVTTAARQTTIELRSIKQQLDGNRDSLETAIRIFHLLHTLSISFFNLYFTTLSNDTNP